jgi:hypothetical protein
MQPGSGSFIAYSSPAHHGFRGAATRAKFCAQRMADLRCQVGIRQDFP